MSLRRLQNVREHARADEWHGRTYPKYSEATEDALWLRLERRIFFRRLRRWRHRRRFRLRQRTLLQRLEHLNRPIAESTAVDRAQPHTVEPGCAVPFGVMGWRGDLETRPHTVVVHDLDLVGTRAAHLGEVDVHAHPERA